MLHLSKPYRLIKNLHNSGPCKELSSKHVDEEMMRVDE